MGGMVAATVFFLWEANCVDYNWKTSMHVGSLVTLVAAVHYFYMREFWIQIGSSPIVYRYIDWSITVPLQMVEFYLILASVQPNISGGMFWRLLVGTIFMLVAGYCGEVAILGAWVGFIIGLSGWGFILYEIFFGEAGSVAATGDRVSEHVKESFSIMRFIVTAGWSIYPLGYFFGYLLGAVNDGALNLVYNLAFRQQDWILPCHLGIFQEGHCGQARAQVSYMSSRMCNHLLVLSLSTFC